MTQTTNPSYYQGRNLPCSKNNYHWQWLFFAISVLCYANNGQWLMIKIKVFCFVLFREKYVGKNEISRNFDVFVGQYSFQFNRLLKKFPLYQCNKQDNLPFLLPRNSLRGCPPKESTTQFGSKFRFSSKFPHETRFI